jgi:hypothetical protein
MVVAPDYLFVFGDALSDAPQRPIAAERVFAISDTTEFCGKLARGPVRRPSAGPCLVVRASTRASMPGGSHGYGHDRSK